MPSPDDLTFGLLPSEDPVLSPEEDLRLAATEAMVETLVLSPDTEEEETESGITGRGWAFDFGTGQFRRQGNTPARVEGEDQIKAWIEKTMYTARFAHLIYSDDYGIEGLNDIIARSDPGAATTFAESIREALLVHDQIASVEDFSFQRVGEEALAVDFRVTLTTGTDLEVPVILGGADV